MESLAHFGEGFLIALRPINLLLVTGGVVLGTVVGMLPGIGPINAIALLLPVVFAVDLPAESGLILLAGIYYGSMYGNSISTILLNIPGTASSVVTAVDGYAATQRGKGGPALAISAIASFAGGTLSIAGLVLLAPMLAGWAIRFGPAEYFALMVFALAVLSSLSGRTVRKGIISAAIGLLIASVGMDPNSAVPRFTFGQLRLYDGIDFVVVTLGLFAVGEVLRLLVATEPGSEAHHAVGRVMVSAKELAASAWTIVRGTVTGFFTGVLPGAGATIATFLAYSLEQRISDREGTFGKGDLRGVAAPESANNAASVGAMIPLLTLGVPGSGTTAVLLGALLGMGVVPGPLLLDRNPEVFWGVAASMVLGNILLLALNLPLVGIFVRVLSIPRWILLPGVSAMTVVAVYSVNRSGFDIVLMAGFGVLGYVMLNADFPLAPVILGVVLGPLMERSLRRSLALSEGDWGVLFSSPIALAFWAAAIIGVAGPALGALWNRRPGKA